MVCRLDLEKPNDGFDRDRDTAWRPIDDTAAEYRGPGAGLGFGVVDLRNTAAVRPLPNDDGRLYTGPGEEKVWRGTTSLRWVVPPIE